MSEAPVPPERIVARPSSLGEGMTVARVLPTRGRRMIGAWCFLDHLGPVDFPAGQGMHVGAHPHTRLQTFTWMIEGEILHRDSLGNEQVIRPGQVNLMTAGHGITHTEDSLSGQTAVHAAQLWIALPPAQADMAPAFEHHPQLPQWEDTGARFTLLAGQHAGRNAPPKVYSPLMGLDIACTLEAHTEADAFARLNTAGIDVLPLSRYCVTPRAPGLVMGFAPYDEQSIVEAAKALEQVLRAPPSTGTP